MADIPGLIEGASKGRGLGIKFLKHTEKTKILIHCIDVSSENLLVSYRTVRKELEEYSDSLAHKEEIILLTKTDLVDENAIKKAIQSFNKTGKKVLTVSIYDDKSIDDLKNSLKAGF